MQQPRRQLQPLGTELDGSRPLVVFVGVEHMRPVTSQAVVDVSSRDSMAVDSHCFQSFVVAYNSVAPAFSNDSPIERCAPVDHRLSPRHLNGFGASFSVVASLKHWRSFEVEQDGPVFAFAYIYRASAYLLRPFGRPSLDSSPGLDPFDGGTSPVDYPSLSLLSLVNI